MTGISGKIFGPDTRCDSLQDNLKVQYLPDYNFNTVKQVIETSLDPTDSTCHADFSQILQDLDLGNFNATTLYQSWGASPGISNIQNLDILQISKNSWDLNSVGASAYNDGNHYGTTAGSRQSCYSSYMYSNSTKLTSNFQPIFCTVYYFNKPHQGFCLPESCTQELKDKNLWFPGSTWKYSDSSLDLTCDLAEASSTYIRCEANPNEYPVQSVTNKYSWIGLGFLSAFLVILVIHSLICTILESQMVQKSKKYLKYLPFSLQLSWKEITNTKQSSKDIKCLHGLRVFSQWWVVCRHVVTFLVYSTRSAALEYEQREWPKYWTYWFFESGMLAVDTFYTIGGFLTGYIMLNKFYKFWNLPAIQNGSASQKFYYAVREILNATILRYLRLTPVMMGLIFIIYCMSFWPNAGSILAEGWLEPRDSCTKDNYLNSIHLYYTYLGAWYKGYKCAGWMWYVIGDFWYYIYAVITACLAMHPQKISKILGSILSVIGFTFPLVYRMTISFLCKYTPTSYSMLKQKDLFVEYQGDVDELAAVCTNTYAKEMYFRPFVRCGPYFIGFTAAYFLYFKVKFESEKFMVAEPKRKVTRTIQSMTGYGMYVLGWAFCIVSFYVIAFCRQSWHLNYGSWPSALASIYLAGSSTWWSLCIVILLILCEFITTDKAWNFPKWLLQHKLFLPLSCLNYAAYAVHYPIINWLIGDFPRSRFFTFKDAWSNLVTAIIFSYMVGFVLYCLVEGPFSRLVNNFVRPFLAIDYKKVEKK